MRRFAPTFIALLLGVFTFNQVILPHVLSLKDKAALCDPLETEVNEVIAQQALKLQKTQAILLHVVLLDSLPETLHLCLGITGQPTGASPHGTRVPIYLAERVLRI